MLTPTKNIGNRGEDFACDYLIEHDFHILERNYRHGRYEIDIIAFKEGLLHIIEVKTRKKYALTAPQDAFTDKKFKSLLKAAKLYLSANNYDCELQFDLIAVEYEGSFFELEYVPCVMSPSW